MSRATLSSQPLLEAFQDFRGTIRDLHDKVVVPAGELRRARATLRRQMVERGLEAGDRVVMAVANGPAFPTVLTAVLEAGASPLLLHWETPMGELERTARRWSARFIVRDREEQLSDAGPVAPVSLQAADWAHLEWWEIPGAGAASTSAAPAFAAVPLHPTSGTSGEPKVALRPGPCAVAEAAHYAATMNIGQSDTVLCVTPMSHAYAYGMAFVVPLLVSAHLVTLRHFNPKLVRRALSELGVTILPAVPAMYDVLLLGPAGRRLDAPRLLLSAGAPLPKRTADEYRRRYDTRIRPLYGTTETGGISVALDPQEEEASVGPPMAGVEVRLRPVPEMERGEGVGLLEVRSSSLMAGYLEDDTVSGDAIHQGWFNTGDVASLDREGNIHLHGRESDIVNVLGLKVIPSEVEAVLATLPQVAEVKVYAGAHKSGSQFVQAAVVAREPVPESVLRQHCEKNLVAYKRPSVYHFLDALPRTPSGKVIRRELPN